MKQFLDISADLNFWLLLGFLFLIPFSIAGCFILFSLLLVPFAVHLAKRLPFPKIPRFFWFFAAYAAFTLVSTFFSVDFFVSLRDNKELLSLLVFPLCLAVLDSGKRLRLSLLTVLVSACLSALIGIGTWALKGVSLDHRLKGLTSHWMTYAGLLMMALVAFSVLWLLSRGHWRHKAIMLLPLLLMSAAIALSLTRSAWVGIAVSLFLFLVVYKPRWMAAAIPLLVIMLLLLPRPVQKRFFSIVDPDDPTTRDRIHMIYTGWRMFQAHPLTGVGANNVEKLYPLYRHPQAIQSNPHLHNNFLQILVERGVLALGSFLAVWIFFFADAAKKIKGKRGKLRDLSMAAVFAVVAFLVAGLFEYNFGDTEVRFLLLYFLALPFLSWQEGEHDHAETSGRNLFVLF